MVIKKYQKNNQTTNKKVFYVFLILILLMVICSCYSDQNNSSLDLENVNDSSSVIDETADESQSQNDLKKQFKVTTFNIGHFSNGDCNQPNGEYNNFNEYKEKFDSLESDFLAINENSPFFDQHNAIKVNNLYSSYPYYICGTTNNYVCNALLSKYKISSFYEKKYNNSSDRYYLDILIDLYGIQLHIIVTHLYWFNKSNRSEQISELLDLISGYDYFVLCGDMNPSSAVNGVADNNPLLQYKIDYQRYKDCGYYLANNGEFGEFNTLVRYEGVAIYPWDNIIVSKNIKIISVCRKDVIISDHYPLSAIIEFL